MRPSYSRCMTSLSRQAVAHSTSSTKPSTLLSIITPMVGHRPRGASISDRRSRRTTRLGSWRRSLWKCSREGLYGMTRRCQKGECWLQPNPSSFFQSVRSGLGDKGFHVHQFLGYHMQSKGRIEGDKSRLEGELASAERELEAQRTALRQLRCSIMEASVPPPMYQ